MSVEEFIGSVLSIETKSKEAYQGQLTAVDTATNSLTLSNVFTNGIYSPRENVIVQASDITNMRILYNAKEAAALPEVRHEYKPATLKTPIPEGSKARLHPSSALQHPTVNSPTQVYSHNNMRQSPTTSTSRQNLQNFHNVHQQNNHARQGFSSPSRRRNEAFQSDVEDIKNTEFDFEGNLRLFDKRQVADEVQSIMEMTGHAPSPNKQGPGKYKPHENVLDAQPAVYRQIKISETTQTSNADVCELAFAGCSEYVTDAGLVIPSVSLEVRNKLLTAAHNNGMTFTRQIEMFGRTSSEMIMMVLGGNTRLNPENAHQQPFVVVICGNHYQGALGVNCARQLAQHGLQVLLYMTKRPNDKSVVEELALYDLTSGVKTFSSQDLPAGTVDIIINALDDHKHQPPLSLSAVYQNIVRWANQCRAPVLNIDPPIMGGGINAKWCTTFGLPLPLTTQCGQIYLCDLGIPCDVYKQVGINYRCPFANKFYIVLHPRT